MSNIKYVNDDEEFSALLKAAGDDLVVIDFYTTWCKPCRNMEPVFEGMAMRYPKALFLKVDADKCFNTAMSYKVSGVPFFVIYFNKTAVETVQGANAQELELKIRLAEIEYRRAASALEQFSRAPNLNPVVSTFGKLGSVTPFIDYENSRCINDLSPTSFHNFLGGKKLVSGKGTGKILLLYAFTQKMMLQSFKIKANPQNGPKVLRFFVNHPKVLDFTVGTTLAPSQEVSLSHQDLTGERAIELRSGSFQMVTNVQIFVVSGHSKNSRIDIESIQLFGAPVLGVQPLVSALSTVTPMTTSPTHAAVNNCNSSSSTCAVVLPDQEGKANGNNANSLSTTVTATKSSGISNQPYYRHHVPEDQLPGHSRNVIEPNQNNYSQQQHQNPEHHHRQSHHKSHHHSHHQ